MNDFTQRVRVQLLYVCTEGTLNDRDVQARWHSPETASLKSWGEEQARVQVRRGVWAQEAGGGHSKKRWAELKEGATEPQLGGLGREGKALWVSGKGCL